MGKKISDKIKNNVVYMYTKTNTPVLGIASILDISIKTLYKILDENKIERRPKPVPNLELAVKLYEDGVILSEIYERANINCATLYKELDRRNISRRHVVISRNQNVSSTVNENYDAIIELYMADKSLTQIANELYISYPVVKRTIDEALESKIIEIRQIDIEKEKERECVERIAQLYIDMGKDIKIRELAKIMQVNEMKLYHKIEALKNRNS